MTTDAFAAETAVAGSIVLDSDCLPEITALLTEDDFALEANRAVFRAAVKLARQGEPIDPVTILREEGASVSQAYLMDVMQATSTAANAGMYAAETRKASMRRALRALGDTLVERTAPWEDPRALIGDAQRELERIEAQDTARELASSGDAMQAFYRHREQVDGHGGGFVPTGFRQLDRLLGGGLLNSGLYVLAARPGMGKTTFALSVADNVAETGGVLFVSLEMDLEQLAAKRLGRAAGISSSALMMGSLSDEERARAAEHSARLAQLPLCLNRRSTASVEDVGNMARKVKGLRLVVIDYFGLLQPRGRSASRYEAMTGVSGDLKALARSLKVPILCLAQMNRENKDRKDKRPQLSDLRDTGALEQDADGVIFLHRTDYYETGAADPWSPVPLQILLEKNRHAGTGVCDAAFYMAVGRIIPAQR